MAPMALLRVKAEWLGFPGAPGYSVLHFNAFSGTGTTEAQKAVDDTRAFFQAITLDIPNTVSIRVSPEVEVINESDGRMTGYLNTTAPGVVQGAAAGNYAAVAGACVSWTTDTVRNGRRVRGRTFLVPLAASSYEPNGTLSSNLLGRLGPAATTLRTSTSALQVYARPSAVGATDGTTATVTGHRINDKTAVLRSRRD